MAWGGCWARAPWTCCLVAAHRAARSGSRSNTFQGGWSYANRTCNRGDGAAPMRRFHGLHVLRGVLPRPRRRAHHPATQRFEEQIARCGSTTPRDKFRGRGGPRFLAFGPHGERRSCSPNPMGHNRRHRPSACPGPAATRPTPGFGVFRLPRFQIYFRLSRGYSDHGPWGLALMMGFRASSRTSDSPLQGPDQHHPTSGGAGTSACRRGCRDYLYIPAGRATGRASGRTYLNLMEPSCSSEASWHGASWNFRAVGARSTAGMLAVRGRRARGKDSPYRRLPRPGARRARDVSWNSCACRGWCSSARRRLGGGGPSPYPGARLFGGSGHPTAEVPDTVGGRGALHAVPRRDVACSCALVVWGPARHVGVFTGAPLVSAPPGRARPAGRPLVAARRRP